MSIFLIYSVSLFVFISPPTRQTSKMQRRCLVRESFSKFKISYLHMFYVFIYKYNIFF